MAELSVVTVLKETEVRVPREIGPMVISFAIGELRSDLPDVRDLVVSGKQLYFDILSCKLCERDPDNYVLVRVRAEVR